LLSASFARAQQPLLTGDAQINSAATTTQYGSATTLTISSSSTALLNFNVADMLPSGTTASQVLKARLILFTDAITGSGTYSAYPITSAWSEATVTYATKPTISGTAAASTSIGVANAYHDLDVTALVQGWITTPSSNYGVALKTAGTASMTIDSKENTSTSHPTVLQVVLSGPVGPQGPAGAKGATGATGPAGPTGPKDKG
jgi:hypothetical protein